MRAYDAALSAPWAMLPEAIESLLSIAGRDHSPQALQAYRATRAVQGERVGQRGNVGLLYASGPMFKRANLFTDISGATSYEMLRRDLQAALDNDEIGAIMLCIDSPGGEASGCDELAAAIYEARGRKPIHAYVSGMAASAAYWLAAAADRIIVSDLAQLGSIGVVLGITDRSKADENAGISHVEFVSSQSPGKRPDHGTDEGKRRIQKMVDDLGQVFVDAVARYRGVSTATVVGRFGAGGVEVGAKAVRAGMADEVGQFETALRTLASRAPSPKAKANRRDSLAQTVTSVSAGRTAAMAQILASPAQGAIPDRTEAELRQSVRDRFKAFRAIDGADLAPTLTAFLRDETDVDASTAAKLISFAEVEIEQVKRNNGDDPETALDKQKIRAGALGLENYGIDADGEIYVSGQVRRFA